MCHALLPTLKLFQLLLRIDESLAAETQAGMCPCGGTLHRANYPRKPRGCLNEVRSDYESRFSFCCSLCRRRSTSMSVRFLGRRVYLGLMVVLASARPVGAICTALDVPCRTLKRWRLWWREQFPLTPLWQAECARFMPPVTVDDFPVELIERFVGSPSESIVRFLIFLTPLTSRYPVALREGQE